MPDERRIVDPAKIMSEIREEPVLNRSLCIPSYAHGYSLAIEYMQRWFFRDGMHGFDRKYFRTIHVDGKNVFDDYRRFSFGDYAKREKPAVIMVPSVNWEHTRDGIDLYHYGPELFARKCDYNKSFFKDYRRNEFLGIGLQQIEMPFLFRIKLSTRAQQMDIYQKMKLWYRVGATMGEYLDFDFHIPNDLLVPLAEDVGIKHDGQQIIEPFKMLKYLNTYSQHPIIYKLRTINQQKEFFIRIPDLYVHIDNTEGMSADDGERIGQLNDNFTIEMPVKLRMPIPSFYIYYTTKATKFKVGELGAGDAQVGTGYGMYEVSLIEYPDWNDKGWQLYSQTGYRVEAWEEMGDIPMVGVFKADDEIWDVIDENLANFISPAMFIDIHVYTNDPEVEGGELEVTVDWENRMIKFKDIENVKRSLFYIVSYVDLKYANDTLITIKDINSGRMS